MNKNNLIFFIVTFAKVGTIKYFPGTFGSMAGLLLGALIIKQTNHSFFLTCFFILTLISIFALDEYLKTSKSLDPKEVVIDEVLGQWIAMAFIKFDFMIIFLSFLIFRFLDITKIFPINKIEKIKGYVGVIGDDLFAGIITAIIIITLTNYGIIQ